MAKQEKLSPTNKTQEIALEQVEKRLDMLDDRLDNIDSIVSALVERVMKQPVSFCITCSKCGNNIEIALIGTEKPKVR